MRPLEEIRGTGVHGGVTSVDRREAATKGYSVGFDCNHSNDAPDPALVPHKRRYIENLEAMGAVVRSREFAEAECRKLCDAASVAQADADLESLAEVPAPDDSGPERPGAPEVKLFEARDRGTFIPVLAVRFVPSPGDDDFLLRRAGYGVGSPYVLLTNLVNNETRADPYLWATSSTPRSSAASPRPPGGASGSSRWAPIARSRGTHDRPPGHARGRPGRLPDRGRVDRFHLRLGRETELRP
jgi:hypothetical protein